MKPIIWERPDGMWSSALLHDDEGSIGFVFFASDFEDDASAAKSIHSLVDNPVNIVTYTQENIDDVRESIIIHANSSPEPLTPDEVEQGVRYASHEMNRMNSDETTLIRQIVDQNGRGTHRVREEDLEGYIPSSYLGKTLRLLSNKGLVHSAENGVVQFTSALDIVYDMLVEQAEATMVGVSRMHLVSAMLRDEQNAGNFSSFDEYASSPSALDDDARITLLDVIDELAPLSDTEIAERHTDDTLRWMEDAYAWRIAIPSIDGAIHVIRLEGRTVIILPETISYVNQAGKVVTYGISPVDLDDRDGVVKSFKAVLRTNRKIIREDIVE